MDGTISGPHVSEPVLDLGVVGDLDKGVPVADQGDTHVGHRLLALVLETVSICVVQDCVWIHGQQWQVYADVHPVTGVSIVEDDWGRDSIRRGLGAVIHHRSEHVIAVSVNGGGYEKGDTCRARDCRTCSCPWRWWLYPRARHRCRGCIHSKQKDQVGVRRWALGAFMRECIGPVFT